MNGVYFGSSTLLYDLRNDLSSKKPKYALKSSFTVLECVLSIDAKVFGLYGVRNVIAPKGQ